MIMQYVLYKKSRGSCLFYSVCLFLNKRPYFNTLFLLSETLTKPGRSVSLFKVGWLVDTHTHTHISMDAHSLADKHMNYDCVPPIVTQETDTFSGHEELSGEFVKEVLMEGHRVTASRGQHSGERKCGTHIFLTLYTNSCGIIKLFFNKVICFSKWCPRMLFPVSATTFVSWFTSKSTNKCSCRLWKKVNKTV